MNDFDQVISLHFTAVAVSITLSYAFLGVWRTHQLLVKVKILMSRVFIAIQLTFQTSATQKERIAVTLKALKIHRTKSCSMSGLGELLGGYGSDDEGSEGTNNCRF